MPIAPNRTFKHKDTGIIDKGLTMTDHLPPKRIKPHPNQTNYNSLWVNAYKTLNYGSSLSSRLLRTSHELAERKFPRNTHLDRVLEVGAGPGIHLDYVRHSFSEYFITDLRQDMLDKAERKYSPKLARRVIYKKENAAKLSFNMNEFNRLLAIHVLEHLKNPHEVLTEWARVVSPGGIMTIVLPCDPGFLWRMGRYFGPRRNAIQLGLEYDYWMAREHINPINNLVNLIRYYFDRLEETWFPARLPSVDLNLFFICHIKV